MSTSNLIFRKTILRSFQTIKKDINLTRKDTTRDTTRSHSQVYGEGGPII
jgi:hypothetical protein